MMEINTKYGDTVKVYAETIEDSAVEQIVSMANSPLGKDAHIRIMPDCHAGAGCTIGTTMKITDKVCPNLVGVDIGCSVSVFRIVTENTITADTLESFCMDLDNTIHANIPTGFTNNSCVSEYVRNKYRELAKNIYCPIVKDKDYSVAIGTLGGGNHFIEVDRTSDGKLLLVIHSGSRSLGNDLAIWYQTQAIEYAKQNNIEISEELAYLEGELFEHYINDMNIVQKFAQLNRLMIAQEITDRWVGNESMKPTFVKLFETMHNYIDVDNMILRKGAVSANKGEMLIIPLNMRDGSLICMGKGNPDWNYSAPHGAGRLLSRTQAKQTISLEDYEESMKGIYTTSVKKSTIDESPFAYKNGDEIINAIKDTAEIIDHVSVVYNYKA